MTGARRHHNCRYDARPVLNYLVSVIPLPLPPARAVFCRAARAFAGLLAAPLILLPATLLGQTLAFPGAQGFGQYATGGRNGTVYHVTSLADDGSAGTFRVAVGAANRTIVFDVGGYIVLNSAVSCANNLTIAGQTAPGGGIGLMGHELSLSARNNEIVRFLRIRPGTLASSTEDGINCGDGVNMIFDHISIEFSPYNNLDAHGSSGANTITVQNSILGDPIGQQFNAHTEASGKTFAWCYNIFASAHNRNPLAKVNTVYINNVVYNYQAGYTVANTGGNFSHDLINNYFISGPSTSSAGDNFFQMNGSQSIYASGNLLDSSKSPPLGGSATAPGSGTVLSAPWSSVTTNTPTYPIVTGFKYDVSQAGALPHDQVDQSVISDVTSLGTSGRMWKSQTSTGLGNNGYGVIDGGTALTDTDGDGMPDIWENATGSNPLVANSLTNTADGYTPLEHYLNWLAAPHAIVQTNATDIDLWPYTLGFTNGATYTVFNFTNCTVTITNGHYAHVQPTISSAGFGSFNFKVVDSAGSTLTNTMGLLVNVVYIPQNLVWVGNGTANIWDNTNTADWFNGNSLATFHASDNVTFDDTGSASLAVNLTNTVAPGSVVVSTSQNYTFSGVGGIAGAGSLTVSGTNTVNLNTANTYSGGTTINNATVQLNNANALGTGLVTLNGGTIYQTGGNGFGNTISNVATGTLKFSNSGNVFATLTAVGGGTLNINATVTGGGLFTPGGDMSGFAGTVNVNCGMRTSTSTGTTTFGSANAAWNFGTTGGVFTKYGNQKAAFGALTGGAGSWLGGANTANAATAGTTYVVGALNLDTTYGGLIENGVTNVPTTFVKVGTGTLTLSGISTHSGATTVSNGTLLVTGNLSNSPVTVVSGATLQGTGFFGGGVTVQSGGIISPGLGNGSFGTMTVSNGLTLAAPTLNFDLSSSPAGANDQIVMQGGTLGMSGAQSYNFKLVNNALGAGNYYLISGATGSTAWSSVANNLPTGTRQTFSVNRPSAGSNPSYTRLTVTGSAASLVWSGTNGSAWDLSTTTNWLNGGAADEFYNLDIVRFDDTSTNGNVSITGTVQPATVLVTNSSRAYTFGGGALGGIASLVKSGPGSLTLNSSNCFSGGTPLNGGTIYLNQYQAFGFGPLTLNGGTLGLGSSVKFYNAVKVASNTFVNAGALGGIGGAVTGSGNLNLAVSGTGNTFDILGDMSGYGGTLTVSNSNCYVRFNYNSYAVVDNSGASFNLGGGNTTLLNRNSGTFTFGGLSGGANTTLTGATSVAAPTYYFIGANNASTTFAGTITDNAGFTAFTKVGTGTLTLTGNNTYTGDTGVSAGTLVVNNTAGSGTGSGVVTVSGGAMLAGTGTIGGIVSVAPGGILAPGNSSPGLLTLNSDLSLDDASVLQFQLGTSSDQVSVAGDLTLGGTLNISDAGGFGPGIYTLFTYAGALSVGTLTIGTTPADYTHTIDTSIQGQVNLIVSQPQFGSIHAAANGVVLGGSGGTPGANYYLLAATNLSKLPAAWTRLLTNQFDGNGNFSLTNSPATNSQIFYRLQIP